MPTAKRQIIETPGRWLARHVIRDGIDHGLSIVTLCPDGEIIIEPFTHETHSTSYHTGTITIDGTRLILEN